MDNIIKRVPVDCKYRHENGNCLPLGGFCSANLYNTACVALQEKAEREKGCATCNKPSLFIKQHKFPYCPHCGRKLGENNG